MLTPKGIKKSGTHFKLYEKRKIKEYEELKKEIEK